MDKERSLKTAVTRAKNKLRAANGTLAEKLKLKESVKIAEDELYNYKLNWFDTH